MQTNRDWRSLHGDIARETEREFGNRPYLGQVRGYDADQDKIRVSGPTGEPDIPLSHPFISSNAWIRAIPESNSTVWLHNRQDNRRLGMLGYVHDVLANRINDFRKGVGVYRKLKAGEIEVNSYGVAGFYARRDGTLEIRGGLVYGEFSNPRLEIWTKAPLHTRRGAFSVDNVIGDEERYGAVRRFKSIADFQPTSIKETLSSVIRKEYYRDLKIPRKKLGGGVENKFLVRMQEGHVVDEKGSVKQQDITKIDLRYLKELFTKKGDSKLSVQVDEEGNFFISLPKDAKTGGKMSIPMGSFLAQIGKDMEFQIKQNFKTKAQQDIEHTSVGKTKHTAQDNMNLETLKKLIIDVGLVMTMTVKILAEIKAPIVKLGSIGPLSGVITQATYPKDYITGWPIAPSLTVFATR